MSTNFENPMEDSLPGDAAVDTLQGNGQGTLDSPAQHHLMTLDEDVLFDQGDGLGPLASLKKSIEAGWLGQVHRHLSNLPEVIDAGLLTPGAGRRRNWRAKWADRAQELMADPHYPYRVKKICWAPLRGDQGPTCGREEWLARNSSVAGAQSELAEVTDKNLRFMDRPGIPKLVVVYLETPVVRGDAKKDSYTVTFVPPNSDTELKIECAVKTDLVNMFVMPLSARVPTKKRLDADRNASTLTGGVSVVMVQNWDLAIVWKQLERDPIFADAYKALRLDADRDKALWPKSRIDGGFRQGVSDGERALIVEMFDVLRQAGCAVLKCDDILGFMDKNELDKLRAAVKDTSAAPVFADFEEALRELDKVGFFREGSEQHAANEAKVEECARRLLADDHLDLSANDVSMMVSDADMDDMEDLCQARSPELYLKAQMLRLALRQFNRKKCLMAMSQAGLIVFTTKCREDFSDGIPRLVTMITAPNDRMEYEAEFNEDFKIRKRVRSIHEALERGPRIPFRCETPDEPYPYTPYFEPPKLATGTNDCVFTHEERQTLIRSIIQAPNNRCTDQDDGSAFPSNSGAAIDLDEAIGEEQCELYFPLHHTEAIEVLQVTWAMNVPQRLGIADTVQQNAAISTTMPPPLLTLLPDILHATQPLDQIRDYFGSHLAWYFAWMGFYTDALSFPTLVGLVVWGASLLGYTQEELPTHALYSVFISVWATLYLQLWTRQQAEQAYDWGFSTSGADAAESLGVSQEFIKKMRSQYLSDDVKQSERALSHLKAVLKGVDLDTIRNDVVDYGLWYFPQQSRSRRQLVTGFVTFLCCVCVMSISQILFIFEDISEDLGVNRQTVYTIKGITAGMLIPSLKFGYHRLAKRMADWETHATVSQRSDSIALKEFVFGYFNSYISLLWIAFFRSDAKYVATDDMTSEELRMQQLKTELFTVMVTAQFLNLAKEVLVPWFQNKRKATKDGNKHTTTGRHTPYMNLVIAEAVREMRCPRPLSNTDEYLKMALQFGYVTMFSSAFPLAPVFAFLNNIFEIRVDAAKLCFFYRRPMCDRAAGIGVWLTLMKVQSVAAVIVNCALLWKFKSQGIDSLVPHFVMEFFATINCALTPAEDGGSGSFDVPDPPPCDYRSLYQTIIACVIVEHLMVIVKMSLSAFIPDKPSRIADDQFVEVYFAEKEMKQYDAMLHRQSNRYSAKKAAAEIEEASFRSETFVAGENE